MKPKTEVIRSREELEVGEVLNGKEILAKRILDVDTTGSEMIITYEYEVKRKAKKKEKKSEEPEFTRIDMSNAEPVYGAPMVTIRRLCRGM